jgi:hypothetical protein
MVRNKTLLHTITQCVKVSDVVDGLHFSRHLQSGLRKIRYNQFDITKLEI